MTDSTKEYKRYRGILFSKEDVFKITKLNRFDRPSMIYAYTVIKNFYTNIGLPPREIASSYNVSVQLINKIIKNPTRVSGIAEEASSESIGRSNRVSLLSKCIGATTLSKLQNNFEYSDEEIDVLLRKMYLLWHEAGTLYSLSERLGISSSTKVSTLISFIRNSGVIKDFRTPKRKISDEQKKRILETKELYDELLNLSSVAKRLGITRERVRQILEKGNDYGLIEYKSSYIKRFDEVANRFAKEDLERLLVQYGSIKKLLPHIRNEFDIKIPENYIINLFKIYNIDRDYLVLQHRKNKCYLEYEEMIQELGYHPTTTVMQDRPKWRALGSRTSRIWGCMDNFRKEFGIPIPSKGNPKFREHLAEFRERRAEIKRVKLERIVEYIDQNSPTNFRDICQNLEIKESPLYQYLKELRDHDLIDWMNHRGKIVYFRKS